MFFGVGLIQLAVYAVPLVIGFVFFRGQLDVPALDLTGLVFDPHQRSCVTRAFPVLSQDERDRLAVEHRLVVVERPER